MVKYNLTNSMIGNQYSFFLGNNKLGESYYLYKIVSPSLSPDCIPYLSLTKISERIKNEFGGKDSDIISVCLGTRKNIESESVKLMNKLLSKEDPIIESNGSKFPLIEMENNNTIQKSIIINLRDQLRRKLYKIYKGRFIDILWTQDQFVLFEVKEDGNTFWLEPVNVFYNTDPEMKNPVNVDLKKIGFVKTVWTKDKFPEFIYNVKKIEWESFKRKNF